MAGMSRKEFEAQTRIYPDCKTVELVLRGEALDGSPKERPGDARSLPEAWRAQAAALRMIAATYPQDHVIHACLLNRIGVLELCAQDLEKALQAMGGISQLDEGSLSLAIEAAEAGLQATRRQLPPDKKAALVVAAYTLIKEAAE